MRNLAAQFDDGAAFEPRKSRTRRPRETGVRKRASARLKKDKARFVRYAAVGFSASLAIGIVVNAVGLQQTRHPAPLFAKAVILADETQPAMKPVLPKVSAALPPTVVDAPPKTLAETGSIPALLAGQARVSAPKATPPTPRSRHQVEAAIAPTKPKSDDPIGKLLKTSAAPSHDKLGDKSKLETRDDVLDAKTILAAQHALQKLGFVIKPNGAFGPVTHAALVAFERDQHLPVTGEMSRKVLKQLSAESGVAID